MKPNKELLDDLMADDVSPEFHAKLMAKTLQSARRRKNARYLNAAIGIIMIAGVLTFTLRAVRGPRVALNPISQRSANVAPRPLPDAAPNVITKLGATPTTVVADSSKPDFSVVETTAAERPREINDKELLAFAGNKPVALIPQGTHKAELIFLNPNDERQFGSR